MNILESATKISLLIITLTVCAGFLMKILPVEHFIPIVTAVFGFYFAYKGDESKPYAGK